MDRHEPLLRAWHGIERGGRCLLMAFILMQGEKTHDDDDGEDGRDDDNDDDDGDDAYADEDDIRFALVLVHGLLGVNLPPWRFYDTKFFC